MQVRATRERATDAVTIQDGKPPRIVAELGRPETPEETAARRAENSRKHRANQTLLNLVLALGASLAIMLFLVLVVVRPDGATRQGVDWRKDAAGSQVNSSVPLAAPDLSSKWSANTDGLDNGGDGVKAWSIGFITPSNQYIGLVQGIKANPTWVSNELQQARATAETRIDGVTWQIYDRRDADDPGNYAYGLSTVIGANSIVLHGTGTNAEFRTLAKAVSTNLADAG
jgi:hypothetical protein